MLFKVTLNTEPECMIFDGDLMLSPPILFTDIKKITAFERVCPSLAESNKKLSCCSEGMIYTINERINEVFLSPNTCHHCKFNIKKLICEIYCHPNNSEYVQIENMHRDGNGIIVLNNTYANDIYESCKNINTFYQKNYNPISNRLFPKLSPLLTLINTFVLLDLDSGLRIITESELKYIKFKKKIIFDKALPCDAEKNESGDEVLPCGCRDCLAVCKKNEFINIEEMVLDQFDDVQIKPVFLIAGFFIILFAIFVSGFFWPRRINFLHLNFQKNSICENSKASLVCENQEGNNVNHNRNRKLLFYNINLRSIRAYKAYSAIFYGYLDKMAIYFISFSLITSLILLCGIFKGINVTYSLTDLLVRTNSEENQNKEFILNNFKDEISKFEICIKLLEEGYFEARLKDGEISTISNIYLEENLIEISKLITSIENIESTFTYNSNTINISYEDICFKSHTEIYDNRCVTFSIFQFTNYFFNKSNNLPLYKTYHDALYAIKYCHKNFLEYDETTELNVNCMMMHDNPISPNYLSGFNMLDNILTFDTIIIYLNFYSNMTDAYLEEMKREKFVKDIQELLDSQNFKNFTVYYLSESLINNMNYQKFEYKEVFVIIPYVFIWIYFFVFTGTSTIFHNLNEIFSWLLLNFIGILVTLLSIISGLGIMSYMNFEIPIFSLELFIFIINSSSFGSILFFNTILNDEFKKCDDPENNEKQFLLATFQKSWHIILSKTLLQGLSLQMGIILKLPYFSITCLMCFLGLMSNMLFLLFLYIPTLYLVIKRKNKVIMENMGRENQWNSRITKITEYIKNFTRGIQKMLLSSIYVKVVSFLLFIVTFFLLAYASMTIDVGGIELSDTLGENNMFVKFLKIGQKLKLMGKDVKITIKDGFNYSDVKNIKKLCNSAGCDKNSASSLLYFLDHQQEYMVVETSAVTWIDIYLDWLTPHEIYKCCLYVSKQKKMVFDMEKGELVETFITPDEYIPCYNDNSREDEICEPCIDRGNNIIENIDSIIFKKHLKHFIEFNDSEECPYSTRTIHGNIVMNKNLTFENYDKINNPILMSYIELEGTHMYYSYQFINSLKIVRSICRQISNILEHEVFGYGYYNIYYEIYITLKEEMLIIIFIILCLSSAYFFIFFMFNWSVSLIFSITLLQNIFCKIGFLRLVGIKLNPLSLLAIIMTFAIDVEYIYTSVSSYFFAYEGRKQFDSIESSINCTSGIITGTLVISLLRTGIGMLNTNPLILQIFMVYISTTIFGLLHSLIYIPLVFNLIYGPIA